uniref:Bm13072, isoform a n=1 Tax=Brugia malayi TaxID=6279 RepID=A0A1I9G1J0_BRUMA|nr:Bm13072, isoform a [Brugia malayi]
MFLELLRIMMLISSDQEIVDLKNTQQHFKLCFLAIQN